MNHWDEQHNLLSLNGAQGNEGRKTKFDEDFECMVKLQNW